MHISDLGQVIICLWLILFWDGYAFVRFKRRRGNNETPWDYEWQRCWWMVGLAAGAVITVVDLHCLWGLLNHVKVT